VIDGMSWSASWPRSRYVAGGGDALVYFEVCGQFESALQISREKYNSEGAPEGVDVSVQPNDLTRWEGPMLEALRESDPDAARAIEAAPQVVTILGRIPDPASLDYLRDTLGLVAALLDQGGVGVVEPQTLQLYSPASWRESFWSGGFEPAKHCVILLSMEEGGSVWLHTRGMRLYGRPDLSCHNVKPEEVELLQPVFNGLIRMQAAGALIPEGQMVQAVGVGDRLICHHGGDSEDPEFNNVHLELKWQSGR
jgi:hypothetical protein